MTSLAGRPGSATEELPGRAFQALGIPLLMGTSLAYLLYLYPPPSLSMAVAAGIGLLALLALTLVRYNAAVALGFLLLGVVAVEPAPPDIVFALVIVVALVTGRFEVSRVPLLVTGLITVFLALNIFSIIDAVDPAHAALFFAITAYLAILAIWLTGFVDSAGHARVVLLGYLAAATISALLGTLALLAPFPGNEIFLIDGCCRAKGLFADPNVYGPFLIPAALIILQETVEPRLLRIGRPLKIAIFLLLAVGVLFSFSRGAYVNLVIGLLVMMLIIVLRRGGSRRLPAILLVLGVAGIAALGALSIGESTQFLEQRSTLQAYDADRFSAQRHGIELASEYPLGVGPGQIGHYSPVATHSLYVLVLAEQGALGLFAFGGLMLATLLLAARNALVGKSAFGIGSAALLGAWCGILANSFVVDTLHWRHLWVIAALIWVASMRRAGPRAEAL